MPGTRGVLLLDRDYDDGSWRVVGIGLNLYQFPSPLSTAGAAAAADILFAHIPRYMYIYLTTISSLHGYKNICTRVVFTAHRAIGAYNIMIRPTCSIYA